MTTSTYNDSLQARISTDTPDPIRQVLLHAWSRDLPTLKQLLDVPGAANVRDPKTGETPLHSVVRGCGVGVGVRSDNDNDDDDNNNDNNDDGVVAAEAKACIQELFFSGAIWNDVDDHDETPGCTAWRLGHRGLYHMFVDAGVRAEMLFGLMDDGYEKLSSSGGDGDGDGDGDGGGAEEEEQGQGDTDAAADAHTAPDNNTDAPTTQPSALSANEKPVTSDDYLRSSLTYDGDRLLDHDLNGVMMAWETDIMRRSVDALLLPSSSSSSSSTNKRILNIGFGMGIIDRLFAAHSPSRHHIIEAHPAVIAYARAATPFTTAWETTASPSPSSSSSSSDPSASASDPSSSASDPSSSASASPSAFRLLPGRWQDVVPDLVRRGELYDAIYFDTFAEDYAQLRLFFTEYLPCLLDHQGRFSFFNGLGADRRLCYDVYARVVELHAADAGLDLDWRPVRVDMARLDKHAQGEWEGVRRRYWTLDTYKLPICTFLS